MLFQASRIEMEDAANLAYQINVEIADLFTSNLVHKVHIFICITDLLHIFFRNKYYKLFQMPSKIDQMLVEG